MTTYTVCISSVIVHRIDNLNHLRCGLCVSRHLALLEVWDHGDRLDRCSSNQDCHHTCRSKYGGLSRKDAHEDSPYLMMISLENCPIALVPAPPAVSDMVPEESIEPAKLLGVPAALLVIMPKF